MFRLLKLTPPYGWPAVLWELTIVTTGVLIALGAQQWAEARSWSAKASASRKALKDELSEHHPQAVEWRIVAPCIDAQLESLEKRLMSSGGKLHPAPVYAESYYDQQPHTFSIRTPLRPYGDSVWQATNGEGISRFLRPEERLELGWHYQQASNVDAQNKEINVLVSRLSMLTKPVEIDAGVRVTLLQQIAELRGHNRWMVIRTGQLIDHIHRIKMTAPPQQIEKFIAISKTVEHCRSRQLPMLSLASASTPAP